MGGAAIRPFQEGEAEVAGGEADGFPQAADEVADIREPAGRRHWLTACGVGTSTGIR